MVAAPALGDPDLLVAILDCNPLSWFSVKERAPLSSTIRDLLIFFNAFNALHAGNELVVIGADPVQSDFIYGGNRPSQVLSTSIRDHLASTQSIPGPSQLSSAMSLAMCYIRMKTLNIPKLHARILLIQLAPDISQQYTATMNCIFSAQNLSVPVDVLVLAADHSLLLQQAAHLTNGVYNKVLNPSTDLLPTLLMLFLPGAFDRTVMSMPHQLQVDYRATCFCHQRVQETGFTCPVCLSVFCKAELTCSTCHTRFPKLPRKARAPPV